MEKRRLRVLKWLGTVPAVGVCTFGNPEFKVPLTAMKRVADAQDYNKILREEQNEEEPQQYSRHAGRQRRMSELERARRPNR
jgi:hypothetical protein